MTQDHKKIKGKRVWFISDTHLGVRNSSNEWIEMMRSYFFEWFIPLVKKNYKKGDILIHLGDVYDSRQSINIKVLNLGVSIFESLSEVFTDGIYVIAGNHDLWGTTSTEINSLKSIKWIPRVKIIEEPESLNIGERTFFLMPWRKDHQSEEETLDSVSRHDVLCCHTDIRGLKFNKYVSIEDGSDISKFSKFGRVYSGHIHYAQKVGNINMLGSPYELTRSDMDNQKSITMLDLETMEDTVFPNNFSPKFKKLYFENILDSTPDEMESVFRNNFIDVMIDPVMSLKAQLSVLTDILTTQRSLNFHPYDPNQATSLSQQIIDIEGKQFNVMDFVKEYVNNTEESQEIRDKMISSLSKLYSIVSMQAQEQK